MGWLADDDAIVLIMRTNPEPEYAIGDIDRERAIMPAHTDRMEAADTLEMQGRVLRIGFEKRELLVGQRPNRFWQLVVALPEARRGIVNQSFRLRPARCSARAASARESNFPAFASAASCSSQAAASNAANHSRN